MEDHNGGEAGNLSDATQFCPSLTQPRYTPVLLNLQIINNVYITAPSLGSLATGTPIFLNSTRNR